MDYESLSTIVLVVIVAILMVSWLPRRTVQGMKQVIKHQSDRYSASLHLIDEGDGTRFSDARTVELKGTPMASPHTVRDREYVAQVRDLRRAAARRRKILVGALLGISVLVFVLAVILVFSPYFTLIPIALMCVVLALGAHASRQAREWEDRHAQRQRELKERKVRENKRVVEERTRAAHPNQGTPMEIRAGEERTRAAHPEPSARRQMQDGSQTDVMEAREIHQALQRAREEQARAIARRKAQDTRDHHADEASPRSGMRAEHADVDAAVQAAEEATHNPGHLTIREERAAQMSDETNELAQINASSAPDAFDMAVNQDLISFSLGSDPFDGPEVVQSMEIKSTRQVSKAVPKDSSSAKPADAGAAESRDAAADNADVKEAQTVSAVSVNDSVAFHNSEAQANVEAPDASSDSLGVDLQSILARRGN